MRLFLSFLLLVMGSSQSLYAQFHNLKIPKQSPKVTETQELGVTSITVDYSSPSVNGRDVWNTPSIIPQNGSPIAWRAGANLNTTISFSTDVEIEGQSLKAGTYGFHIIPRGNNYTLFFAHNSEQWGSYYLDTLQDVSLKVVVQDTSCAFSEKLDFEFYPKSENAIVIALEWADKRIPFTVSVDLNKTVVESFRQELRGANTYRWEAWNDAAGWCLRHDTNLEEALQWADRSINGGYNGFGANKNLSNLTTKARLLQKLERKDELKAVFEEATTADYNPYQANNFIRFMLGEKRSKQALNFTKQAFAKYPDSWFLELNLGVCYYLNQESQKGIGYMENSLKAAPEQYHPRINEMITEMKNGTYKLP